MYAVIATGGKQYRVCPGDSIEVEKLPHEVGEQIELDQVLLVADGTRTQVGRPWIENAKVRATVTRQAKGRKVVVFKYKNKNRYRRTKGHRQHHTRLRIDEIVV